MGARPGPSRHWLGPMLLRLHFYAGILVAPFLLVSAASGALYAVMPQVERIVYAEELTASVDGQALPLAEQVAAARGHLGEGAVVTAVRPAPEPGDTTRVMVADSSLGESESRAVMVDPSTGEIRGDLTVYGTSGSLPLRTWVDQLHRNLHLGEAGRLYSELSASWLGVIALAGLGLWIRRARRARRARDLLLPEPAATGYRRTLSLHSSLGVWVLLGALFLAATGITWSRYGGATIGTVREALGFTTAVVSTELPAQDAPPIPSTDPTGEHAGHEGHGETPVDPDPSSVPAGSDSPWAPDLDRIDDVLAAGRAENIDTTRVEIRPPADADSAWVVEEIQRSFPTKVDSVAVAVAAPAVAPAGADVQVVDRVDFADADLAAKLTRWGIDLHMGTMFGLANQIVLLAIAAALIAMILWGYRMWWQRGRAGRRMPGAPPRRGALRNAPWRGVVLVLLVAGVIGVALPVLGASLVLFVVVDTAGGLLRGLRDRAGPTRSPR